MVLRPGEPFSFERVLESQRRLSGLGIFERVSIAELDPEPRARRDVVVSVQEAPRTSWSWGVGYSEQDRLRGSVELTRRNLGGLGRTASVFARGSFRGSRFLLNLREPWLFGRKLDSFLTGFWEEEDRTSFDYNRKGGIVQDGPPLDPRTSLILRYLYQDTNVFNVEVPIDEIDRQYRTYAVSGPSASVVFDTRDDPLEPKRGIFLGADLQLSLDALGGESYLEGFFQATSVSRLRSGPRVRALGAPRPRGDLRRRGAAPAAARALLRRAATTARAASRWTASGPKVVGSDGELYPTGGNALRAGRRRDALQLQPLVPARELPRHRQRLPRGARPRPLRPALERRASACATARRSARSASTGATSWTRSPATRRATASTSRSAMRSSATPSRRVRSHARCPFRFSRGRLPRSSSCRSPPTASPSRSASTARSSASSRSSTAGRCCCRTSAPSARVRGLAEEAALEAAIDERLMHVEAARLPQAEVSPRRRSARSPPPRDAARAARRGERAGPAAAPPAPDRDPEVRGVPLPPAAARERRSEVRAAWETSRPAARRASRSRTSRSAIRERLERRALDERSRPGCASCGARADVRYVGRAGAGRRRRSGRAPRASRMRSRSAKAAAPPPRPTRVAASLRHTTGSSAIRKPRRRAT